MINSRNLFLHIKFWETCLHTDINNYITAPQCVPDLNVKEKVPAPQCVVFPADLNVKEKVPVPRHAVLASYTSTCRKYRCRMSHKLPMCTWQLPFFTKSTEKRCFSLRSCVMI